MSKPVILICHWLSDGELARWTNEFSECDFVEGHDPAIAARELARANIVYGLPDVAKLAEATGVRWIQLASAGVPATLCPVAAQRNIGVTNLAGLYGPSIAEHALALMLILSRNLQVVQCNQAEKKWERSVANTMRDLHGKTLAVVGLGNIGVSLARLARSHGMRVIGCCRRDGMKPFVDRLYPREELKAMLAEADVVCVTAPLTRHTEGMLGDAEFAAMKKGVLYVNVSRGGIAQEAALLAALQSGQVAAAGLDVFAVEPLPADHPFWTMPQVIVHPHISGEVVNQTARPAERFARNLAAWCAGRPLEGQVDLDWGY
jgi:phosphoglycerate dehydrogenase-like enzyme